MSDVDPNAVDPPPETPWAAVQPVPVGENSASGPGAVAPVAFRPVNAGAAANQKPASDFSSILALPMLCLGLGIIACCVLIPLADENRHVIYERERLKRDLEQIQKQASVNEEFLKRVADDPTLAQRLAQRQMKLVRDGTTVLDIKGHKASGMSPFALVTLAPPAVLPEPAPPAGLLAVFHSPRMQLYLTGGALLLIATSLVLGSPSPASDS